MGKKRNLDIGLEYLQKINFERARGKYALNDRLIRIYGREKASEILDQRHQIDDSTLEFYEFKNSSYELSTCFSEVYDGDIIRKACNYINEHKESFGDQILEIGCESGYITGFLALTFPESHIVAIDRSENAIKNAKRRIEPLNVNNVEFKVASVDEITGKYDTVFSMRTLQENLEFDDSLFEGNPLMDLLVNYSDLVEEYAKSLISLIANDGYLVTIERCGKNPLSFGWMNTLNELGCGIDLSSYTELQCEECGDISNFQAFVARCNEKKEQQDIYDLWYKSLNINSGHQNILNGWGASVYLMENAGNLEYGFYILGDNDYRVGKFALYTDRDNESLLYYYQVIGAEKTLYCCDVSLRDEVIKKIDENVKHNVSAGLKSEKILEE